MKFIDTTIITENKYRDHPDWETKIFLEPIFLSLFITLPVTA